MMPIKPWQPPQVWGDIRRPGYRLNYSTGRDALIHIESDERYESFCGKKLGTNYQLLTSTKKDLRDPFICRKCKELYRASEIVDG